MSSYDETVVESAKALVRAKVRAKGTPTLKVYTAGNGKKREFILPRSWTKAEYWLYVAVTSEDS